MTFPVDPLRLPVPPAEQMRALLASHLVGIDRWVERNLGPGIDAYDVPFGSVFTVTEAKVVDHALARGWDPRIVKPLDLAEPRTAGDWDVLFFAGASAQGDWQIWRPLGPERNAEPFEKLNFQSERAMVEAIVARLFSNQRRFWG